MRFVSRAQWGAQQPRYDLVYIASTRGVKVHYEGDTVPASLAAPDNHAQCDDRMRAIQASHLANREEDYSDIAYNAVVCPHGYVFEGRGAHKKTAANGNQTLNKAHYAVCAMLGSKGLTKPTDAQLGGLRDAIEWLRAKGSAGDEILGHKDGYATACPGKNLYTWVKAGAPRPKTSSSGSTASSGGSSSSKPPAVDLSRLIEAARTDPGAKQGHQTYAAGVRLVEKALLELGFIASPYAGDGSYGTKTVSAYARWQHWYSDHNRLGWSAADCDGIPGKESLAALGKKTALFTVTA